MARVPLRDLLRDAAQFRFDLRGEARCLRGEVSAGRLPTRILRGLGFACARNRQSVPFEACGSRFKVNLGMYVRADLEVVSR